MELLLEVLHHVGSAEFKRRTELLTINRRWYSAAYSMLYEEYIVTAKRPMAMTMWPRELEVLMDNVRHLKVDLCGYGSQDWEPGEMSSLEDSQSGEASTSQSSKGDRVLNSLKTMKTWKMLNKELKQLSEVLPSWQKLQSIHIRATAEQEGTRLVSDGISVILLRQPEQILRITSLIIDMDFDAFRMGYHHHNCPSISKYLPQLYRLHVRLPRMCAEMLDLSSHASSDTIALREIVLNSVQVESRARAYSFRSCKPCNPGQRTKPPVRCVDFTSMDTSMKMLVERAPRIKVAKLIIHQESPLINNTKSGRKQADPKQAAESIDYITGDRHVMPGNAAWTDEFNPEEHSTLEKLPVSNDY